MWREIAGAALPFDEVWGALIGTVVGAWLGAVGFPFPFPVLFLKEDGLGFGMARANFRSANRYQYRWIGIASGRSGR